MSLTDRPERIASHGCARFGNADEDPIVLFFLFFRRDRIARPSAEGNPSTHTCDGERENRAPSLDSREISQVSPSALPHGSRVADASGRARSQNPRPPDARRMLRQTRQESLHLRADIEGWLPSSTQGRNLIDTLGQPRPWVILVSVIRFAT